MAVMGLRRRNVISRPVEGSSSRLEEDDAADEADEKSGHGLRPPNEKQHSNGNHVEACPNSEQARYKL